MFSNELQCLRNNSVVNRGSITGRSGHKTIRGDGDVNRAAPATGHERIQQFGSQYRPGTKDSPQESQSILERFTSANKKIAEVCQKVS